jgi:hypothetical protein
MNTDLLPIGTVFNVRVQVPLLITFFDLRCGQHNENGSWIILQIM